jgi:hypothetical protein
VQALQQLRIVAEFFRRTEPHSPVAYLAERAASWGEMPLHVWLRAVIKDPSAIAGVEELLGPRRRPIDCCAAAQNISFETIAWWQIVLA